MKNRSLVIAAIAALSLPVAAAAQIPPYEAGLNSITVERSRLYVETLADDGMEGRQPGTPGSLAAADRIVEWFKEIGAVPFLGDSYYQIFDTTSIRRLAVARRPVNVEIRNVLAMIEGTIRDEYVIVGGHYDHVGVNPEQPGPDKIRNGADDNASGTGGVLHIARAIAASGLKPQRTIVFALWDAEEMGLVGSRCFGATYGDMNKVRAYFNMDMIGRDGDGAPGQVSYYSTDTAVPYARNAQEDVAAYGLNVEPVTDPRTLLKNFPQIVRERDGKVVLANNSDYAAFEQAGVTVYNMCTGIHPDYHKVGDESNKIDWRKMTDTSKLAFLTVWRLANPGVEIVYPE